MDGLVRPVGPLPSRRYWRRRVGLLLTLVTAGVVVVMPPTAGGGDPGPLPADDGAAATQAVGSPGTPADAACRGGALDVALGEPRKDPQGYLFVMSISSSAERTCTLDVRRAVTFTVTSGTSRVHRSAQCAAAADVVRLEPGQRVRATLRWPGRVSPGGGCTVDGPRAPAGYYVARVRLGAATDTSVIVVT